MGAESGGVSISLPRMLEAGANCLPVALLFLGIAALAYAIVPRASAGIAYGLVTVAFLWDLVGSLLGVPRWLVELTPFAHVGLVPAQPFRGAGGARHARDRGAQRARGAVGLPPARPGRSVRGWSLRPMLQKVTSRRARCSLTSYDGHRATRRSCDSELREHAKALKGARILHVNATAYGGGVSELLRSSRAVAA